MPAAQQVATGACVGLIRRAKPRGSHSLLGSRHPRAGCAAKNVHRPRDAEKLWLW